MRILRAASQAAVPWKNGGGTTREIVRMPADSTLDSFDWRVSRAHVGSDGPFSSFADVDRTLLVLTGDGIRLDVAGQGAFTLTPESAPFSFAGDVAVMGTLIHGPIDDLNVMTRRGRARHDVTRRRVTEAVEIPVRTEAMVVVVESGELIAGETALVAGDALWCDAGEVLAVGSQDAADIVIVDVRWPR